MVWLTWASDGKRHWELHRDDQCPVQSRPLAAAQAAAGPTWETSSSVSSSSPPSSKAPSTASPIISLVISIFSF